MPITTLPRVAALLAALAMAGCQIAKQEAPDLIGPSGLGVSVALSASPDVLRRDGQSMAEINVRLRGPAGEPLANRAIAIGTSGGTLTATEVTTDANGVATFGLVAPPLNSSLTSITVTATPVGTNFDTATTHQVVVALSGPTLPTPSFTFTPEEPARFDLVQFDASATTVGSTACLSDCTYAWNFGDGATGNGRTASHRFESQGNFRVTLTVTSSGGVSAETSQTVTVGAAAEITATITMSPTNPRGGETVIFSGVSSTTPDGVEIAEYTWDFGDGDTGTGSTATNVYPTLATSRTYTVTLTIRDALGRTDTATATLAVAAP
ncbi:MAG: PKD domain-containing protein [Vicinamibacterales bacterium]